MSQRKETIVLLLALLLTLGLVGAGAWGFKDYFSKQFFAPLMPLPFPVNLNNFGVLMSTGGLLHLIMLPVLSSPHWSVIPHVLEYNNLLHQEIFQLQALLV